MSGLRNVRISVRGAVKAAMQALDISYSTFSLSKRIFGRWKNGETTSNLNSMYNV